MLDQLYHRPSAIRRHFNAPFLEERQRYLEYRAKQGAVQGVLYQIACYQLILIKHLHLKQDGIVSINEIKTGAQQYAAQHSSSKKNSYLMCKKRFIYNAIRWLSFLGRIEIPIQSPMPIQIIEFADYMRKERNLSEVTIDCRVHALQNFFSHIKEELGHYLAHLTTVRLDELLTQKLRQKIYARSSIQYLSSTLRTFLCYAGHRGWCQPGIADSIKSPRVYKHQELPSSPSWDDVRCLLKTTEGDDPSNIRARAILLLLAVYGLRSSEVLQLRLEDFDWERRIFLVRHSKGGSIRQCPLVPSVGQALVRYIKKIRPRSSPNREIFLTRYAPVRPLRSIWETVARRWKPLKVAIKHHGPHSLRHACATRLINQGIPLKTIADQLGHRDLQTTGIYAKVDLTRLRQVANFDMGGLT